MLKNFISSLKNTKTGGCQISPSFGFMVIKNILLLYTGGFQISPYWDAQYLEKHVGKWHPKQGEILKPTVFNSKFFMKTMAKSV